MRGATYTEAMEEAAMRGEGKSWMEARTKAVRKEAIWMGVKAEAIGKKALKTVAIGEKTTRKKATREKVIHS